MSAIASLFTPLRNAYGNLEPREQRSLAALGAFLLFVVAWVGVFKPVEQGWQDNAAAYQEANADLVWMQAHAAQVQQIKNDLHADDAPLVSVATDEARAQGIVVSRAEPQGDGSLHLTLNSVSFARMLSWLEALERKHGISPAEFSIESPNDAPGHVNASLLLRRGEGR
jgi:type II secretory pathway component PulM